MNFQIKGRGGPHGIMLLSAERRGADQDQMLQCCRRHPTVFLHRKIWNNDFEIFQKCLKAKSCSGSLPNARASGIGQPSSFFQKN